MSKISRKARVLAPLALVALSTAFIAACGGQSAQDTINKTFSGGDKPAIKSGKIDVSLSAKLNGNNSGVNINAPITAKISGAFQDNGAGKFPKLDLDAQVNAVGRDISAGLINTGSALFVSLQGVNYEVPQELADQFQAGFKEAQDKAKAQNNNKDENAIRSLGIKPETWLVDPKDEGEQEIGGTNTRHVSAQVDTKKMLVDINGAIKQSGGLGQKQLSTAKELTQAQIDQASQILKGLNIDIWSTTDDNQLRQFEISADIKAPAGMTNGFGGAKVDIKLTLSDVNEPQQITAPSDPQPFDELQKQLKTFGSGSPLGGLSGN